MKEVIHTLFGSYYLWFMEGREYPETSSIVNTNVGQHCFNRER